MQNSFNEWEDGDSSASSAKRTGTGGWHWILSVIAVLTVSLFSFGMAFLTRRVEERPVWMMGLIFMIPTAALMLAAMMVESATSAMTPGTSRKPQIIVAVAATVITFMVGCICDLIYLEGFRKPPARAQSEYSKIIVSDRLVLVKDRTISMTENGADQRTVEAISAILDRAGESWEIGFTDGKDEIRPQPATPEGKQRLMNAAKIKPDQGRLYYRTLLENALKMSAGGERTTRIILFTDGAHPWSENGDGDLTEAMISSNTVLWCVAPEDTALDPVLVKLIERTGGKTLRPSEVLIATDQLEYPCFEENVKPAEHQEELNLQLDLIRNRDRSAQIITFVMLLLEGLSLGICLSLMLSTAGQFRAQYIISPLMGVLAFVLLKLVWKTDDLSRWWIAEGICFSLLGVVFMKKNLFSNRTSSFRITEETNDSDWS